jgi:hypothetical protein
MDMRCARRLLAWAGLERYREAAPLASATASPSPTRAALAPDRAHALAGEGRGEGSAQAPARRKPLIRPLNPPRAPALTRAALQ